LRSDLVVDTNIYNCEWVRHATREGIKTMLKRAIADYASNHRGAATLNQTSGFDRIFGPSFNYINRDGDVETLLADAEQYA
jgi:rhamnogalacturonan endolyase